jgi:hypothetical protein
MESNTKNKIEQLMNESNVEFDKNNLVKSIDLLIRAWSLLPEPKNNEEESFFIVKYIIETNLKIGNPYEANKWIKVFYDCDKTRNDLGDRKYIEGKVAYALCEMERAKKLFIEADKLTKGRCFEENDVKYKNMLKQI